MRFSKISFVYYFKFSGLTVSIDVKNSYIADLGVSTDFESKAK